MPDGALSCMKIFTVPDGALSCMKIFTVPDGALSCMKIVAYVHEIFVSLPFCAAVVCVSGSLLKLTTWTNFLSIYIKYRNLYIYIYIYILKEHTSEKLRFIIYHCKP